MPNRFRGLEKRRVTPARRWKDRLKLTGLSLLCMSLPAWAQPLSADWDHTIVPKPLFSRASLFPTYANKPEGPTSAEIVALSADGYLAVYADSLGKGLGFVDLHDLHHPKAAGWVPLSGEPTSVVVLEDKALVACDTGSFTGRLDLVDCHSHQVEHSFSLPGQPDSLALSPDHRYLAVAIENESENGFPEDPPGNLTVFTLAADPSDWAPRIVDLRGYAAVHPEDPEPEYVTINSDNLAAVTLQENNHVVLVDLPRGAVVGHFPAGEQKLVNGSTVPREPDGIAWCGDLVGTADEGDWKGGGRGFTLYDKKGRVVYNSADLTEQLAAFTGQYPLHRAQARGTEPESILSATLAGHHLLFVGCERANLVQVFELSGQPPLYRQTMFSATGPESIACCPERGLVVLGSEVDDPKHDLRAYLTIYTLDQSPDPYHIFSKGIPWAALSGLGAGRPGELWTLADKALLPNRLYRLAVSGATPILESALELKCADGAPAEYDLEGIAVEPSGIFWLVAEGKKKKPSLLLQVTPEGTVQQEIEVPGVSKYGLEGVTSVGGMVYVAFQSQMAGEPPEVGRLGRYNPQTKTWKFARYPLKSGHFITGLSPAPNGRLAVLERDKKSRERARHKMVFTVNPAELEGGALAKAPLLNLVEEYRKRRLPVPEKLEGLAFDGSNFWVINDNDAVKSSYGETLLLKVESPRYLK